MYLILHNIRSAENVGSMFRTADAFGVQKIYITGYTPAPVDKFKRPISKIAKTALGAEQVVPWESGEIARVVEKLKAESVCIVGLEQDPRAVSLSSYTAPKSCALIVGNEVDGIESEIRELCDDILEIPMLGTKESLNVSVAAGIALFHLAIVDR